MLGRGAQQMHLMANELLFCGCYTRECFGFCCNRADDQQSLKTWPLRERAVEAEYSTVR